MAEDTNFISKQKACSILEKAKDLNAVILFVMEVSFAGWGAIGETWAHQSQQPKVLTSGFGSGFKNVWCRGVQKGSF